MIGRMPRTSAATIPFRSPAALVRFLLVAAVGLTADLYTKGLAAERLATRDRPVVGVAGWVQFRYVTNFGAVFGIAPGQRWAFLIVSVLAVAFLSYLFANSGRRWFFQIVLGLLMAGVLGNLYDRITLGYVRDMIEGLPGWRWPEAVHRHLPSRVPAEVFPYIFNVADVLLCTGVGILLVGSFFSPAEPKPAVVRPAAAADPA